MENEQNHELDTFRRVKDFGEEHVADFGPDTVGGKQFAKIAAAVPEVDGEAVDQQSAKRSRAQATIAKKQTRPDLHTQLKIISESAHALAELGTPGLEAKFRMPRSGGHNALLTTARQFKADALPLKDEFLSVNMPADFIETLQSTIDEFGKESTEQGTGLQHQVGSTKELVVIIDEARKALRILNPIVRNTYRKQPEVLAAWTVASHVETTRAHHKQTIPPTPAPTPN